MYTAVGIQWYEYNGMILVGNCVRFYRSLHTHACVLNFESFRVHSYQFILSMSMMATSYHYHEKIVLTLTPFMVLCNAPSFVSLMIMSIKKKGEDGGTRGKRTIITNDHYSLLLPLLIISFDCVHTHAHWCSAPLAWQMLGLPIPTLAELVPTLPTIIAWFGFNAHLLFLGWALPGMIHHHPPTNAIPSHHVMRAHNGGLFDMNRQNPSWYQISRWYSISIQV